ncbi:MAG TPA: hypothetical protein VFY79_03445, partial [Dehalococcoidia bacterium]|nr:hypothetical protein [Dehalococcoidia bacterium]
MWSAPGTRSWPCAPLRRRAGAGARATEAQSVADRIDKLIAEEIPPKLERDTSYQNAMANGDRQNARIEHDEALGRIITAMVKDDAQLY